MVATFYDMSDTKFSIRAIAPPDAVRQYAICKAVWFAEKKHVTQMSVSNPAYGPLPDNPTGGIGKVPEGSVTLTTTAYLNAPSPDGNPMFSVAEKAGPCRQWDWYR
jgi:hypothetical protein